MMCFDEGNGAALLNNFELEVCRFINICRPGKIEIEKSAVLKSGDVEALETRLTCRQCQGKTSSF